MISRQFIYIRKSVFVTQTREKSCAEFTDKRVIWEVSDFPSQVAGWIINAF